VASSVPLRVLVIDDDPGVRELVSDLLVSFGYECDTAANGTEGLARYEQGRWDLVLTDLSMPGMSGWDVVARVRRRRPDVPIVVLTGLSSAEVSRRAAELGVPLVRKPFRAAVLREALTRALGGERLPSEP
jgi:CheY-like chemotaxis protein